MMKRMGAGRTSIGLVLMLAGLMLVAGSVSAEDAAPSEQARMALRRGMAAAGQEEWELAVKYFSQAREEAPYWSDALFNLATACNEAGGRELLAIAWFRAYLAASEDAADAEDVRSAIIDLEIAVEGDIRRLIRESLEHAERIDNEYERDPPYCVAIDAALESGDFEMARRIPARMKDPDYRDSHGPRAIGCAVAEAGNVEEARRIVRKLRNAEVARSDDRFSTSIEQVPRVLDAEGRPLRLGLMVLQQADGWDNFAATCAVLVALGEATGDHSYFAEALEVVSDALPQARAGGWRGSRLRAFNSFYIDIGRGQARAGDIEGARKTAAQLGRPFVGDYDPSFVTKEAARLAINEELAVAYARKGDFEEATQVLRGLDYDAPALWGTHTYWRKVHPALSVAIMQAEQGDAAGARKMTEHAARPGYIDEWGDDIGLVKAWCAMGEIPAAWVAAAGIPDDDPRAEAGAFILEAEGKTRAAEIESWSHFAVHYPTRIDWLLENYVERDVNTIITDLSQHLDWLGGKGTYDVSEGLARAALELAKGLNRLNDKEAYWQERR